MHTDPKSTKIQSSCQYLFAFLGSALVKAADRALIKLILDVSIKSISTDQD